ncbi:hypothetical protein [Paractinoplanes lichenicola]|uniref:Uncharacterized protein n=1 Tax=Paractinoplanes lichenicola TaxID=2802976 RepID=A0ABS1W5G5_9ACTN|nr:hypothetical protein [Actinoplanes lichenicola]MBL7261958.1 hypothetical protein [Actinoplanes lichenicola]
MRPISGLVCGAVTTVALGLVLSALAGYQVRDHGDLDPAIGLGAALLAAIGTAGIIAVIRTFGSWPRTHVLVPLLFLPAAIAPLVLGLERNRIEAGLVLGAAAFAIHLSLGRRHAVAAVAVTVVVAGLAVWGLQDRWRAQKFEAVGVPLYVPEIPGYRLSAVWAGHYSVTLKLTAPGGTWLDVQLLNGTNDFPCGPGRPERAVYPPEGSPKRLGICLPEGGTMLVSPGYQAPDVTPLLTHITVRAVDGATLAEHPDGVTSFEPD